MRIIFAGTPEFAEQALAALITVGHEIVLVLTQPYRPAGRGMNLQASALQKLAQAHGISVYQPERLKDPATHAPIRAACDNFGAEIMVVAAYGLILPQAVLDIPPRGCLNIHASLLPRWRGAAPIHRAIEAGDASTGITIMQMDAGLDTGAMLLQESVDISADDTTGSLHNKLARVGGDLIVNALAQIDTLTPTLQPNAGVTYATKISKTEAQLDWSEAAEILARKIRAFNPFPGATFSLDGEPVKVWRAETLGESGKPEHVPGQLLTTDREAIDVACGQGTLRLLELQSPGGRRVTSTNWLNAKQLRHH